MRMFLFLFKLLLLSVVTLHTQSVYASAPKKVLACTLDTFTKRKNELGEKAVKGLQSQKQAKVKRFLSAAKKIKVKPNEEKRAAVVTLSSGQRSVVVHVYFNKKDCGILFICRKDTCRRP